MTGRRPMSLSQRLMLSLGLVSLLYWIAIAGLTSANNVDRLNELYDVHLARSAKAFLQLIDPDPEAVQGPVIVLSSGDIEQLLVGDAKVADGPDNADNQAPNVQAMKRLQHGIHLRYQLWRLGGGLLAYSSNAPKDMITTQLGYSDAIDAQGLAWRHYSFHDAGHQVKVIVSEPHEFRQELVRHIVIDAATPLALGLPLLLLLLWLSIQRGLLPLDHLQREISRRQADNLQLLSNDRTPREVKPIVQALNALLQRVGHTLEQERRFTDDAAHQLRTPLAAIQAQLYAVRHLEDREQRLRATDQLQNSVARAIRLVNQMLALARLDPEQPQTDFAPMQLDAIAETVCAELAPIALQRDQTLELSAQPGLPPVHGNADMLSMLMSNLIDNAIHYTQRGGQIRVQLAADADGGRLSVTDDGPGIAAAERERVLERFYRVASQSEPGTGLGLAICQRIAEQHRTRLSLGEGLHGQGLAVTVVFALQNEALRPHHAH